MKSGKNYPNKVALVQSKKVFAKDARIEYLKIKNSQLLTSTDEEEIFDFIKNHASKNGIYHFVLHIDSEILSNLILYMAEKKRMSNKTRTLLEKCKLIATCSNAGYDRVLNEEKGTGIMFALSPLSEVLESISDGRPSSSTETTKEVMLVVSDTVSEYFRQIYGHFNAVNTTLVKLKASQLTKDVINDFVSNEGYIMVLALDTEAEYDVVGQKVDDSNFKEQIHIIECTQPQSEGIRKMQLKASDIQTSSSGVCINASGLKYPSLNSLIPYGKTAALLTQLWSSWGQLENANIFIRSESY